MFYKNKLNQCENSYNQITYINITEFSRDDDLSSPGESQFNHNIARFSIYDSMAQ